MTSSAHPRVAVAVMLLTTAVSVSMGPHPGATTSPPGFDSDVQAALAALHTSTLAAKTLEANG